MDEKERVNKHRYKIYNSYYKQWKENPVYCPYLKKEVFATKSGWEHTAGMSKPRSSADIHRRLDLFKYALDIVAKSGTCQSIRYLNGEISYGFYDVVQFRQEYGSGTTQKLVKVIVIQRSDGVCFYYSVMD